MVAPVATMFRPFWLYAKFRTPSGKVRVVIVTGAKTCNDRLAVAKLLPVSAARTVMFAVVAEAAVPLITPAAGLSVKPDGRVPLVTDHVYPLRPPEAARVVL